jgi:hypothetical protein
MFNRHLLSQLPQPTGWEMPTSTVSVQDLKATRHSQRYSCLYPVVNAWLLPCHATDSRSFCCLDSEQPYNHCHHMHSHYHYAKIAKTCDSFHLVRPKGGAVWESVQFNCESTC